MSSVIAVGVVLKRGGDCGHAFRCAVLSTDARIPRPGLPGCGGICIRFTGLCRSRLGGDVPGRAWRDCLDGGRLRSERWNQQLLQLLSAILAVATVITFLVSVLMWLAAFGMTGSASQVA